MDRSARPQTSGVGSVKFFKTPSHDATGRTAFDLKLKESHHFSAHSANGSVSPRRDCRHQALVHQPAGLRPEPGPLLPVPSGHQHQTSLHPGLFPGAPPHRTWQDPLKVLSPFGPHKPKDQEGISRTAAQSSSARSSGSQHVALPHPEPPRDIMVVPRLTDKRNTETVQSIRVRPSRRFILPRQDPTNKVIQPEEVSRSWQKRHSTSAEQKSVQSAVEMGHGGEASPQRSIVLQPAAGTSFQR